MVSRERSVLKDLGAQKEKKDCPGNLDQEVSRDIEENMVSLDSEELLAFL